MTQRVLANSDILELEMAVPQGHRHLRATLRLRTGEEIVLQEATLANLVRGYVAVKTHPLREGIRMQGRDLGSTEKKDGFADWQLLEDL
ncbi:hypothetical protein DESUT3_14650 [Desulfuromonas versatilis]|uniref:Uncharacterized protein n=1 Tax=Desulfuromonas versatilis TaxID=2802975 RepID=A0ABM8HUR1_9BACT|nr:hypothetical protein [Desulfuromonas versatilis]BCR04396.1 hypothetical protein DESUT3_14650 [Desulfuromonas versatilis]